MTYKPQTLPTVVALLALAVASPTLAAETPTERLLVMPLKAEGVEASTVALVENQLAALLGQRDGLEVMTHAEVQALVDLSADQQGFNCSTVDSACLAELGVETHADLMLAGVLGQIGQSYVLNLTLMVPQTAKVKGRGSVTVDSASAIVDGLAGALQAVFGGGAPTATVFALNMPKGHAKAAVMPLASNGVKNEVARSLTQVVTLGLRSVEGLSVIAQDEIAAMLQLEADQQAMGCDDASCFAEIGGALGVDYLIIGSVGRLEDTYLVGLKLLDAKHAKVINRVSETFKGRPEDLIRATRYAVGQLVGVKPAKAGRVVLNVVPPSADVRVDGTPITELPQEALRQLSAGRHSFSIEADGHYSHYLETYVEPGLTNTVVVALGEIPRPWYRQWWVWTAAVGLAAGLGGTYYYTQQNANATGAFEVQLSRQSP